MNTKIYFSFSWKFICINLWRDCLYSSEFLNDLPKNSSVFLHQVDVEAPAAATETLGWFFIDEIIVSDQDIFGNLIFCFCPFLSF